MGDCQLRAVAWSPAVSHAGGVKSMPPLLHVFSPQALSPFMRSFWVPVAPCLLLCVAFYPGPLEGQQGAARECCIHSSICMFVALVRHESGRHKELHFCLHVLALQFDIALKGLHTYIKACCNILLK